MHIWSDLIFALLIPLLPAIKDSLGLTYAEVGLLRSTHSGATAVLQVPAGFLAEYFGEFWMLVTGNLWASDGLVEWDYQMGFGCYLFSQLLGVWEEGHSTHWLPVWFLEHITILAVLQR